MKNILLKTLGMVKFDEFAFLKEPNLKPRIIVFNTSENSSEVAYVTIPEYRLKLLIDSQSTK